MMWPPAFVREMIETDQKDLLLLMLRNYKQKLYNLDGCRISQKAFSFTCGFLMDVAQAIEVLKPDQDLDEIACLKVWADFGYIGIDPFEIDEYLQEQSGEIDEEEWPEEDWSDD